jgi:hypothetical protein
MAELAIVSSRRTRLRILVEQDIRGSRRALALGRVDKPIDVRIAN